ncbi:hypothetical protein SAMN05216249_101196 [Acetitomaculum ruminis DSM 5522]|uniref:Chemotaxis phosphatase CheX n=1 Tax=Acetitomaculum ruminis DSM 5522 TaxID=1120918 RepID=A0A1I0V729_9FIRM|nr:chemotaxis protein CheX [Acetitomaculum ruminis]SFA72078.1 hypothetical protein SAMN05216249_101196 [Acetitomaculum ruminis DSM 5522]
MYTQFFGNYLLNKKLITREQLLKAMEEQTKTHIKLGTLAIYQGYMTASEVENVHILQTHEDRRFGEVAIEEGYLTPEQVELLCSAQKPDYLYFGQSLINAGVFTTTEFESLLEQYKEEYEIGQLNVNDNQREQVIDLVTNFYRFDDLENTDKCINYLILFFNNLIRFIGGDFTPLSAEIIDDYSSQCLCSQSMEGDFSMYTAIDMDEETTLEFASRYTNKKIVDFNEYVTASVEDFLNLHNGLFLVNMSNEFALELNLDPLESKENVWVNIPNKTLYFIPILFPFGSVNVIIAI